MQLGNRLLTFLMFSFLEVIVFITKGREGFSMFLQQEVLCNDRFKNKIHISLLFLF